jgi:hypothetical protein
MTGTLWKQYANELRGKIIQTAQEGKNVASRKSGGVQ